MEINKLNNESISKNEWIDYVWAKLLKDVKNRNLRNILNFLLSRHEKKIIVNRLAALILIREGKTYQKIGEELWLSPTTIRSLKRILENNFNKEYQSYNGLRRSKDIEDKKKNGKNMGKKIIKTSAFIDWIDYYASVFPRKNGPRWKFFR